MKKPVRLLSLLAGLVLIGNFIILRLYGDALRSTYLFIVRSTVFYPVAWLNLVLGVMLLAFLGWELFGSRNRR